MPFVGVHHELANPRIIAAALRDGNLGLNPISHNLDACFPDHTWQYALLGIRSSTRIMWELPNARMKPSQKKTGGHMLWEIAGVSAP